MLKIALTGGIASGKTTVSDMFAALGVPVIDADILAREAVAPGSDGLQDVVARFGDNVIGANEQLDRSALREIVFSDSSARQDLEAIIHPRVRELTQQRIAIAESDGAAYCLVVIPLLVESARQNQYDHVLVVDVDETTQLNRLLNRDGNSEAQSRRIIASQATREQRLAVASHVIENNAGDNLAELQLRVNALHTTFCALAGN